MSTEPKKKKRKRLRKSQRIIRWCMVITGALLAMVLLFWGLTKLIDGIFDKPEPNKTITGTVTPGESFKTTPTEEAKQPTGSVKEPTGEVTPGTTTPSEDDPLAWNSKMAPGEVKYSVCNGEITLEIPAIPESSAYEINYCPEDGENQQTIVQPSEDNTYRITVPMGAYYTVQVRSLGPNRELGALSEPVRILVERPIVTCELNGTTINSATFTCAQVWEGESHELWYRAKGTEEWETYTTEATHFSIGALTTGVEYEAILKIVMEGFETLESSPLAFTPDGTGFGDPFAGASAVLNVGGEKKHVTYSSAAGCLGIDCWMEFADPLYADPQLTESYGNIDAGQAMRITADEEGRYVCYLGDNRYSVHVYWSSSAEEYEAQGWVLANALLVDLAQIYPSSNPYSIHYNRTNAYASIFTCGGNALEIEDDSAPETRYDPLRAGDATTALTTPGYNLIEGITGQALPKYSSRDRMPAVWDVAISLLTAQRNALAKGYGLLIYESYRPNSTSKAVYRSMKDAGYFREEIEVAEGTKLTLANGFFTGVNFKEENYIAVDSNHNKGIALDLTIEAFDSLDVRGAELVMQTKMHALDYRGNMEYNNDNANALYDIMTTGTGLVPLRRKQEWWHFELGKEEADFPCIKKYVFADYEL